MHFPLAISTLLSKIYLVQQNIDIATKVILDNVNIEDVKDDKDAFHEDQRTPIRDYLLMVRFYSSCIMKEDIQFDVVGQSLDFCLNVSIYSCIKATMQQEMYCLCLPNKIEVSLSFAIVEQI